jgi:hypothetical protein
MRIGIGQTPIVVIGPNMPTPTPTPASEYNPQTDSYTPTVDTSLNNLPLLSSGSAALANTVENSTLSSAVVAAGCADFFDMYFDPSCGTPYGLYAVVAAVGLGLLMGMRKRR